MKVASWLDHLPPWLSLLSLAPTGLFAPRELLAMGTPLALAALVEWRGWDITRWRRLMELGAVLALLLMGLAHLGLPQILVYLVFLLCGVRLALPRELAQCRQLILMGFLLFLMAAMSAPSPDFAVWAALWTLLIIVSLTHQAWPSQGGRPPLRTLGAWSLAVLVIASACFLALPRLQTGNRLQGWGIQGLGTGSGLADSLELNHRGALRPTSGTVLRIIPPPALPSALRMAYAERLSLLKGYNLEALDETRWEISPSTPRRNRIRALRTREPESSQGGLEFQVLPSDNGLIPLPYGALTLRSSRAQLPDHAAGGAMGWSIPPRQATSLEVILEGDLPEPEQLSPQRSALLGTPGAGTEAALRWSRRVVATECPATELATRLSQELQSYHYTLDNPSGNAPDPLADFLERTRSGHCEYFASALACALRGRRIPARVVVGYRLGAWIPEGGYWLVTQSEAHSWVEYFDASSASWHVSDPTPAGTPLGASPFMTRLRHAQDALMFRWDRYVVRFSGQDQLAGYDWAQRSLEALSRPSKRAVWGLLLALVVLGLAGTLRHGLHRKRHSPKGLRELAPLLRKTRGSCPPAPGESARAWLRRLAALVPEQGEVLLRLADEVDSVAYGNRKHGSISLLAKEAARNFRAPRPKPIGVRGLR